MALGVMRLKRSINFFESVVILMAFPRSGKVKGCVIVDKPNPHVVSTAFVGGLGSVRAFAAPWKKKT